MLQLVDCDGCMLLKSGPFLRSQVYHLNIFFCQARTGKIVDMRGDFEELGRLLQTGKIPVHFKL
jgi:hypothetical protein